MANVDHIALLKKGVDAWNAWRKRRRRMIEAELTKPE